MGYVHGFRITPVLMSCSWHFSCLFPHQITVILKNWRECAEQQIYQAELDNVPPAFEDGSVTSGDRRGHQSLRIHSHDPGRHAEIWATHIGTTIVVRQVGRSLSLSVRSPRAIVESYTPEQDLQLCVWGCPVSQRLEIPHAHPSSPAYSHCSSLLPVRDAYFQACLFDLQVTGNVNSSASAVAALEDARAMISDPDRVHLLTDRAGTNPPSLPVVLALSVLTETLRHTILGSVWHQKHCTNVPYVIFKGYLLFNVYISVVLETWVLWVEAVWNGLVKKNFIVFVSVLNAHVCEL